MNLGDGLLFELENGKPKLILLNHGETSTCFQQLSIKPRTAQILSFRQPVCVEEVEGEERAPRQVARSHREVKCKPAGDASSSNSNTEGRNTLLTSSKGPHKDCSVKARHKVKDGVKSNKPKLSIGPLGANGKAGQPLNSETQGDRSAGLKHALASVDEGLKDGVVCLTNEELQQILNVIKIPTSDQHAPEEQAVQVSQIDPRSDPHVAEEEGKDIKERDKGGVTALKSEGGGTDADRRSQGKENNSSRFLFSWLDERQSDDRATINARKAQWRRELDEQVALKQQQQQHSAPGRLQAEEYAESVSSVQTCFSHREQPAAIRSSLRLGEVTPMEEVFSVERKREQRRHWLEELDHQRKEVAERRRREKLLQNQTEDHERWAAHFDSLQKRPHIQTPVASAPPPGQLNGSVGGDWGPTSSLSLAWDATSSCGADSVVGASLNSTSGYPTRTHYLRTMTSLLDPAQIEERERRRLKQLEQQRAIEAQMEERRKQKEQEEFKRRQEEEEEESRVALEREKLRKHYELEVLKKKQKEVVVQHPEQPEKDQRDSRRNETLESSGLQKISSSSVGSHKDTAVQTDETPPLVPEAVKAQTPDTVEHNHPPPPYQAAPPTNSRSRGVKSRKENICLPTKGDPYEAFARTERSRRDKKRPEWNTHRPSCRYVPASERYPVALQKNRQENRLRRQAELLALQERTYMVRTEPLPPQHQEPRLGLNTQQTNTGSTRKMETSSRGKNNPTTISSDQGRYSPVTAVQNQQDSTTPPVLEFIPYIRTDEVFHLDPLETADTPPPQAHSGAPPECSASPPAPSHGDPQLCPELLCNTHTHRQQEILRGLAQLRQGLLQKKKDLETDLNPLWNHRDELRVPSTAHPT
ncbi:coiled-coil domain containing 66 [Nothobranchius furzeri]|uniref:Coiled-coil domain containing 66 n=1 Tax=Nothobranchius furzeri TaxID=105023 RepID=A0A9D3BI57_NOTFU|nr:coiled-coil domain containing 66 [Nothobranchius furzeri]